MLVSLYYNLPSVQCRLLTSFQGFSRAGETVSILGRYVKRGYHSSVVRKCNFSLKNCIHTRVREWTLGQSPPVLKFFKYFPRLHPDFRQVPSPLSSEFHYYLKPEKDTWFRQSLPFRP